MWSSQLVRLTQGVRCEPGLTLGLWLPVCSSHHTSLLTMCSLSVSADHPGALQSAVPDLSKVQIQEHKVFDIPLAVCGGLHGQLRPGHYLDWMRWWWRWWWWQLIYLAFPYPRPWAVHLMCIISLNYNNLIPAGQSFHYAHEENGVQISWGTL